MLLCRRISVIASNYRILKYAQVQPIAIRLLSTKDVFGVSNVADNVANIPDLPKIPVAKPTVEDLYNAGQSVIEELGLFTVWKPSGYFRYGLEYVHLTFDIPWWATIMCGTVLLRLVLIGVPIMSQKFVARQSKYKKELNEFRDRINDAKRENNTLLIQQIFLEQRDFMVSKNIKYGRQFFILATNGTVFMTQFFALKKMVAANFPGFSTGGALWFQNLCDYDPYYILPAISAATLSIVMKYGIESGTSSDQMTPFMRLGMVYGLPIVVFALSSQFSSAICLYWCTSNAISLFYSGLFRVSAVRSLLNIPPIVKDTSVKAKNDSITAAWKQHRAARSAPPSLSALRQKDAKEFKKAGRGKPMINVEESESVGKGGK